MDDPNNAAMSATSTQPLDGHRRVPNPILGTPSMFPTEVYERIIDFLASEAFSVYPHSPSPLTLCCLTSRLWFPRSRFHLYFEVTLRSRSTFERFAHCLEINPSNSHLVKKLCISPFRDQGWVPAFPLTLAPKLKKLSTLIFRDLDLTSAHPSFFQHLSIFSTVSRLRLVDGKYRGLSLTRMILALPRLQKVASPFFPLFGEGAVTLAPARRTKPLPLRYLFINEIAAAILLPALIASATPLAALNFQLFASPPKGIEHSLQPVSLFLSSCDTLRTLRLYTNGPDGHVVCPCLCFSSLSNLHHLLLRIATNEAEDISAVASLLSSISTRSLQFLQLDLYVGLNREILKTSGPWEVLNETLLRPHVHSTREIAISMTVGYETFVSGEVVSGLLPALETMNVVNRWSEERYDELWNGL